MEIAVNIDITRRQVDSTNLRDLLRIKQDDESRTNLADQTLSSSSNFEKRGGGSLDRVQSSRTLRDIIREDSKKSWKCFKDKLIRRQDSGSRLVSSVPIPASDVPIHRHNSFRNITRWDSTRITIPGSDGSDQPNSESGTPRSMSAMLTRNATIERPRVEFEGLGEEPAEEENNEEVANGGEGEDGSGGEEPLARMSLMALLAETDKPMGINESSYAVDEDDEEGGREYNNCCVCMVRHKGSAFIPCGHTFCRLCSRELWVQRGNCPLCNNLILEILDIF